MYGCFSFCLVTCKLDNFLKNRTIKLLEDKLWPDFYYGFFWSEENVHLNYFPTHNGATVLVYTNGVGVGLHSGNSICHHGYNICQMKTHPGWLFHLPPWQQHLPPYNIG